MSYKEILYDKTGGFPFDQQTLEFMQDAYTRVVTGLGGMFGDNVILSGVEDTGSNYTDGWVAIGGEVLPFEGGLKNVRIIIEQTATELTFEDTNEHAVEVTRVAKCASTGGVSFSSFKRLGQAIRDASIPAGTITHLKTDAITDHFDLNTGLGISDEWKGWQIDPDAKGRVIMGWDGDVVEYDHADGSKKGGLKSVILNESEMPSHAHDQGSLNTVAGTYPATVNMQSSSSYISANRVGGANSAPLPTSLNITLPQLPVSGLTGETGGDQPHENRPPYVVYLTLVKL